MEKINKVEELDSGIEFSLESWEDVQNKEFDLLASGEDKKHLFRKLGYEILKSGDLVDPRTKEGVKIFKKDVAK